MSIIKANSHQIGQSLTATNNATWYQPASPDGTVRLGVGNAGATTSDVLVANSSGNVGIGTSSPSQKLVISGANVRAIINGTNNAGYATWRFQAPNSGGTSRTFEIGLNITADDVFQITDGSTAFVNVNTSGNLGLGVTPSGWSSFKAYQVNRASVASTGADTYFSHNWYWSGSADIYISSDYATRYSQQSGQHRWWTAPSGTAGNAISFTRAMTLDASGALCIGQTSKSGNSTLSVSGPEATVTVTCTQTDTTRTAINFYQGATASGYIRVNGANCYYQTVSDQRLKTNITPAGSAIQSILDFPVDQFDWIADGTHQDFGAVAQKAINFIPEMVSVPADEDEMWGIDWSKAVPRLIKTIQELSAELNELKQRIH